VRSGETGCMMESSSMGSLGNVSENFVNAGYFLHAVESFLPCPDHSLPATQSFQPSLRVFRCRNSPISLPLGWIPWKMTRPYTRSHQISPPDLTPHSRLDRAQLTLFPHSPPSVTSLTSLSPPPPPPISHLLTLTVSLLPHHRTVPRVPQPVSPHPIAPSLLTLSASPISHHPCRI
jgi:hypothetical protein